MRSGLAYCPDQLVPEAMSYTQDVGFGNSIFVSGAVPELGTGDITKSLKLVYNTGAIWTGRVGLPPSTAVAYRYYNRADGASSIGSASNGTALGSPVTTTTAANPLFVATAGKTLDYYSGWTAPRLQFEISAGSYTDFLMTDVGAGRSAGERRWRAAGFGVSGRAARFRITDGAGAFDVPAEGLYETFLDRSLLQDGNVFDYEPAATVSASQIVNLAAVASPQGLQSRAVRIYLPRGYAQHTARRYPVMYMHDGQNLYGTSGSGFPAVHWNVDGSLDRLIRHGQVREVIVVGIDNTSDRLTDYTPPNAPSGGIANGKGDKYLAFVRDTVKPMIDANYRTLSDRANTTVAGSSLGALMSTYFALQEPTLFSRVGAFSPAYWANTNVPSALTTTPVLPAWRHYMDTGAGVNGNDVYDDMFDALNRLVARGQVLNMDVWYTVGVGQDHNESAWQARFPGAMRYLLPIEDEPNAVAAPASGIPDWIVY